MPSGLHVKNPRGRERARAIRLRRSYMTQEDWSGTGETSQTSSAGSWNEPAADAEAAWGDTAIEEATESAEAERAVAVPATTRSSLRSLTSSRSSGARKKSTAKKSTAKNSGAKKKAATKKKTARKSTAKKATAKKSTAKRKTAAKKSTAKRKTAAKKST